MADDRSALVQRNFILNAIEGGTYIASNGFFSVQTVLPALVTRMGGSNVLVGAASVVSFVGTFLPQLFAARYAESSPWKKKVTVWGGFAQRLILLLIGVSVFVFGTYAPGAAVLIFFLLFTLNQCFMGIVSPFWFDFITKLTPARVRGRLIGLRTAIGGMGAFVGGFGLTWILVVMPYPANYALAIVIASGLQFASLVFQWSVREDEPSEVHERLKLKEYLASLREVLKKDRDFKRFLFAMAFIIAGSMPVAFFAVFGLRELGAAESAVGEFTIAMVVAQICSALLNGVLADRYGNKIPLLIAGSALALASVLAFFADSVAILSLVFVLVGVNVGTEVMSRYNMAIEYCPQHRRSTYLGLMNTLLAPCYGAGILGGILIGPLGYRVVFLIGAFCASLGVLIMMFAVPEPRIRAISPIESEHA